MKKIVALVFMLVSTSSYSAGWVTNQTLKEVAVKYGNGCLKTDANIVVIMDLTSEAGKAEFSIALSALAAGKTIDIYQTDGALVSGCDVGETIKPHSMLKIDK